MPRVSSCDKNRCNTWWGQKNKNKKQKTKKTKKKKKKKKLKKGLKKLTRIKETPTIKGNNNKTKIIKNNKKIPKSLLVLILKQHKEVKNITQGQYVQE